MCATPYFVIGAKDSELQNVHNSIRHAHYYWASLQNQARFDATGCAAVPQPREAEDEVLRAQLAIEDCPNVKKRWSFSHLVS